MKWFKKLMDYIKGLFASKKVEREIGQNIEQQPSKRRTAFEIAKTYIGQKEIKGKKHNPIIQSFYQRAVGKIYGDETPWCMAFVNSCLMEAGCQGTGKLNARSALTLGEPTNTPKRGDIVIFWRGSKNGWKGHVGFFVDKQGDNILVLGGNQHDRVNISPYPSYRVLGFRRYCNENK